MLSLQGFIRRIPRIPHRIYWEVSSHILPRLLAFRLRLNNYCRRIPITRSGGPVVSLTTYGIRIRTVDLMIESIARGYVLPSRMILWLDDEKLFANPPATIRRLLRRGLEVKLCSNFGPHTKYYPYLQSTESFDIPLVTADDDALYSRSWLKDLFDNFNERPHVVNCHLARVITLDHGQLAKYVSWDICKSTLPSFFNVANGVSGVIYPPQLLEVLKKAGDGFKTCCPKADDLWLHVQALRSGYSARQICSRAHRFPCTPGTGEIALWPENVRQGNDRQAKATYTESDIEILQREQHRITVNVPASTRFFRKTDSDWLYNHRLLQISDYIKDFRLVLPKDLKFELSTNARLLGNYLFKRLHFPLPVSMRYLLSQEFSLPLWDLKRSHAQVVLAYERFPANTNLPVVWIVEGPPDLEKLKKRGSTEKEINHEINFKRMAAAKAAVTVFTSEHKRKEFESMVGSPTRSAVIPFFIPIEVENSEAVLPKWSEEGPIHLLFIGRAAVRKGLPLILDAYEKLLSARVANVSLHVISSFDDGKIVLPNLPGLTYQHSVPHKEAILQMRKAHFLLMPSREESYGWVYIEAMSQGTIPVATDKPVQRELFGNGKYGLLVEQNAEKLFSDLKQAIKARRQSRDMAMRALLQAKNVHSPAIVAHAYGEIFRSLVASPDATSKR